jgi:methylthioribulose-1-phosphate dehydratase
MNLEELKQKIAQTIRSYHVMGWSPSTSTNYSFRDLDGNIWVSRSGIDKIEFSENDFIIVNSEGIAASECSHSKPSAETLIHCAIYQLFPETKVILHSHSIHPVVLSSVSEDRLEFEGYEIQKGFAGRSTHQEQIKIPVFENTQDMSRFILWLKDKKNDIQDHCFVIRKHGTYAWGKDLFEAKRHLETLDYLCNCELIKRNLNHKF